MEGTRVGGIPRRATGSKFWRNDAELRAAHAYAQATVVIHWSQSRPSPETEARRFAQLASIKALDSQRIPAQTNDEKLPKAAARHTPSQSAERNQLEYCATTRAQTDSLPNCQLARLGGVTVTELSAVSPVLISDCLDPISVFFARRLCQRRAWAIALMAFSLYYIGSCVAAGFSGTLLPPSDLTASSDPLGFTRLIRNILPLVSWRSGEYVPLLGDFAHLNFSVICFGFIFPLGYKFLSAVPREFQKYFRSEVPEVDRGRVLDFFGRLESSLKRRLNLAVSIAFGIVSSFTFVFLARSNAPAARDWWGHSSFGYAGYYLAIVQGLFCYYAMWGFGLVLILNRHIQEATRMAHEFHPFHTDGYYGFRPLARLLGWQAGLALLVGLALFSTYYMGYFGLERLPLVFLSMAAFTVVTFAGLAWPFWALTVRVRQLRDSAIREIEPQMHRALRGHATTSEPAKAKWRKELVSTIPIYEMLTKCRTVPFTSAEMNAVIFGYLLQSAALVREFYAHFR